MAERLVILSDMWGIKKGLWITSYLGYLQQHYDIVFYDCQQLANINEPVATQENIHRSFVDGGIATAVAHLLKKEQIASHYLAFSMGGVIAWKAGLLGLPMKSLYAISATRLRLETQRPKCPTTLVYGSTDDFKPGHSWSDTTGVDTKVMHNFGHELYADEKIVQKVCQDLLRIALQKPVAWSNTKGI